MKRIFYYICGCRIFVVVLLIFLNDEKSYEDNDYEDNESVNEVCSNYSKYYDEELSLRIVNEAKKYVGIPYLFGSEIKDNKAINPVDRYRAIDCSDFVEAVLESVFNKDYETTSAEIAYQLKDNCVSLEDIKPGDILLWDDFISKRVIHSYGRIFHVGIYLGNNRVIESTRTDSYGLSGVVYSDLYRYRGGNLVMIVRAY